MRKPRKKRKQKDELNASLFQVFLGSTGAHDMEGNELPRLVYVSREKRPGYQHHKKAGAENALVKLLHKSYKQITDFLNFSVSFCAYISS